MLEFFTSLVTQRTKSFLEEAPLAPQNLSSHCILFSNDGLYTVRGDPYTKLLQWDK